VLGTNKQWYGATAGLCADALGADPKLAADLKVDHPFIATKSAALAARQGEDATKPNRRRPCALCYL
jgi:hypothetical protein